MGLFGAAQNKNRLFQQNHSISATATAHFAGILRFKETTSAAVKNDQYERKSSPRQTTIYGSETVQCHQPSFSKSRRNEAEQPRVTFSELAAYKPCTQGAF